MSFQLSLSTESVTAAYPETPTIVAPDATVEEVLQLLRTKQIASVLVCASSIRHGDAPENGAGQDRPAGPQVDSMLGIFTERDALKWMATGLRLDQPVSEVMSQSPVTVTDQATVGQAIGKMAAGGYRHLPILAADGTPVGMAVVHGIVHYLVDHFPETIYTLPPTPDSVPSEREGA